MSSSYVPISTILPARITAIRGSETELDSYDAVRSRGGGLGREYVVTYRPGLADNERLVAGQFWPSSPPVGAQVSIEEGLADIASSERSLNAVAGAITEANQSVEQVGVGLDDIASATEEQRRQRGPDQATTENLGHVTPDRCKTQAPPL